MHGNSVLKSPAPTGKAVSPPAPHFKSIKHAINKYCEGRLWPGSDTKRLLELSDSEPFDVTPHFALYKQFFVYRQVKVSYGSIEALNFRRINKTTINVSADDCTLQVFARCMAPFTLSSFRFLANKPGTSNCIPDAYHLLSRITFQQRMAAYIKAMEDDGYAMIEGVRVYPNGSISQEQARTNPVATTNRGLPAAGPQRSGSGLYDSPGDSFEFVAISGMGAVSRWIRNRLTKDQDVVTVLLSYLGK